MDTIINKQFKNETIVIDDKSFIGCSFTTCDIVYGGGDFGWVNSKFEECRVTLTGTAQKTANFMQEVGIIPKPGKPDPNIGGTDDSNTFH